MCAELMQLDNEGVFLSAHSSHIEITVVTECAWIGVYISAVRSINTFPRSLVVLDVRRHHEMWDEKIYYEYGGH